MTEQRISFRSPPVVEVVAGVALDDRQLRPETGPQLAAFWHTRLRERFPRVEHQPSYTPTTEQFPATAPSFQLQWNVGVAPTRLWALTDDGQELLQLQPGWFACNWRKVQPQDEYDRWPARRSEFARWFRELTSFLADEGLEAPRITQCEVTYVNHIRPGDSWTDHVDIDQLLKLTVPPSMPLPLEQVTTQAQYLMQRDGAPVGRVHVRVIPAYDQDGKTPLYVLEITARGVPAGPRLEDALAFLTSGRDAINDTFVAITTRQMQQEWERES